jgi:hypothetical protein
VALAVAAAASALLIGGAAQAGEPQAGEPQAGEPLNQDGPPGKPGSATNHCRTVPPQDDAGMTQCTARPGMPGAPGPATKP